MSSNSFLVPLSINFIVILSNFNNQPIFPKQNNHITLTSRIRYTFLNSYYIHYITSFHITIPNSNIHSNSLLVQLYPSNKFQRNTLPNFNNQPIFPKRNNDIKYITCLNSYYILHTTSQSSSPIPTISTRTAFTLDKFHHNFNSSKL